MKEQLRTEAEKRNLVYAKNINNEYNITGLIDISKNPPKIYCFCTEEIAKEILDFHAQQSKDSEWISVTEKYPDEKQTVWCYSEKLDNVFLGEYVYVINEGWFWAESNGVIYASDGKIVSECEMDDFDVSHWFPTPLLPKKPSNPSRLTT